MRAIVQRVAAARVEIGQETVGEIGQGLMILLGVSETDTIAEVKFLAKKLVNLRIFTDENDKMNLSLADIDGEALVVSQFTLYGNCKKGNRPSFIAAGRPEISEPLYEDFVHELIALGVREVATGRFGADMQVYIQNDGPVTLMLDTDEIMPARAAAPTAGHSHDHEGCRGHDHC